MNQHFAEIVKAHFPELEIQVDRFGNDREKMLREHYAWEIETLADCADGLDANNLRELIEGLKVDPLYIMQQVIKCMEADLQEKIELNGLCPNCLAEMQVRFRTRVSHGGYEPSGNWMEACGSVCPECGWEE